jgi:beta-lactamase regulating signal transducer with metallopeptidase domain
LIGLLLIARAALQQRRAFAARTRVTDAARGEALERLLKHTAIRQPVRLSRCAAASTPLVLSAREICLPERAMELDQDALEAVLAHELAHIERRDGFWLNCALVLQALLWFQPLNRKARAKLQESAELAADDRAVQHSPSVGCAEPRPRAARPPSNLEATLAPTPTPEALS